MLRLSVVCLLAILAACTRDPNIRKQKYFDSGGRYFSQGLYREAAIQYSNAIQIDSRYGKAHYQLARTFLKLDNNARAYQELSRTVELDPSDYRAHADLANLLVTVRNPDGSANADSLREAKTHLDLLRDKQPNVPETHEAWSNYYGAQNDLAAAMQEMQRALALDPKRSEFYLTLGLLQLRANLLDQAEGSLKQAIAADPKTINAQLALGGFYQAHHDFPAAEAQFHQAIDVDPEDPAPRAALVRVLMQEGKKDEIESFLLKTKKDLPKNSDGYRMLGDFYYATGDLDKAVAEYASLYHDHSSDVLVKKNYVELLILKNSLEEADKLNNEILKSAPADVDALVYKGQLELRRKNTGAAIDALQQALHNDSGNAIAHYQLGLAFDQQHDSTRAESEWREAVRLRPDLTDAQRALASLELFRGDFTALAVIAQQIVKDQPDAPDGYLLRCVAEIGQQKYNDAQQDALQAMQKAPQSSAPYVQMGNIHGAQKQYAEAEKAYQQALEKDPSSSEALGGLMNSYVAEKQYDKAIAAARAQIARSPDNSRFYELLGTALFDGRKDLPGAETALRKSVELDKNNTDALEKLGKVEIQEGDADQALGLYLQSIKDNPQEVRFYILAGELYESKQNWDQAKNMYQRALQVQPDQPLASNNLAYVMLSQGGNVDLALTMAQAARRTLPDWPNAADTLGWAYYQKGVYQSAIGQFQEALRLGEKQGAPDDPVVHYHLGMAYEKANQTALARQQLEKALKLSPNNADAKKALSELRG
jgi:cellulose synthase operon protein C